MDRFIEYMDSHIAYRKKRIKHFIKQKVPKTRNIQKFDIKSISGQNFEIFLCSLYDNVVDILYKWQVSSHFWSYI